jgi:hypothetical protein
MVSRTTALNPTNETNATENPAHRRLFANPKNIISMPLHPAAQQMIRKVEALSGRPVHVAEDADLKVMATVTTARGSAPAHFLRYRPGVGALDYLIVYQLGYVERLFSCPVTERWEVVSNAAEHEAGIRLLGLDGYPRNFAVSMVGQLVVQLRSCSVGARVDDRIWNQHPDLREQQETSIRKQLDENGRALAPEIRERFPKALVDANSVMNAAFAIRWGGLLKDGRFRIPYQALGYEARALELLRALDEVPDAPDADRALISQWAECLGLDGIFHFEPHLLT